MKKEDVSIGLPRIVGDETSSVQEEEKVEIPTEEQTLTATPQGICDKTEEITVDAANNNNVSSEVEVENALSFVVC